MAKGLNQKFKLYYLKRIMLENTDADHGLTMPEIVDMLDEYDVTAERKSLYRDLNDLEKLGVKVSKKNKNHKCYYYVKKRKFEMAELKLLVDAIQSSKFITERQSKDLIKKLEGYVSSHDAKKLQRQVYVQGRVKTKNESTYNSVDAIHIAIEENKKINFKYWQWNAKKEMEERHNGKTYVISPWALIWNDENYYLIAYDSEESKIKHFRVDKMKNIKVSNLERDGKDAFKGIDIASYAKSNFGMFGGKEVRVGVKIPDSKVGIFIDRFGQDISIFRCDKDHVEVKFNAAISLQFYGWIFGLGEDIEIISPTSVVEEVKAITKKMYNKYK